MFKYSANPRRKAHSRTLQILIEAASMVRLEPGIVSPSSAAHISTLLTSLRSRPASRLASYHALNSGVQTCMAVACRFAQA